MTFTDWFLRCREEKPPTCCLTSWCGVDAQAESITVTGGRGCFMIAHDLSWRMTDRIEFAAWNGTAEDIESAWLAFLEMECTAS